MEYCCIEFDKLIRNYDETIRVYTLIGWKTPERVIIKFCPCCGKSLPKSLQNEWKEILMKEYGIEEDHCSIWNPMVSEEFKSDAWWKNRGL